MTDLTFSEEAQNITLGHYRHYKGGEYDVLYIGRYSEHDEPQEVVIYQDRNNKELVWVQSVSRFLEKEGDVPRFAKVL